MLETCRATVLARFPTATAETVYVVDGSGGPSTDEETANSAIVVQWRMATETVSGECRFDEAGNFVEFVRQ